MLFYGADANTFLHEKTPLMRAIQYGASDVLELLLSHKKIALRMQNREKESALTYAMKYRRCGGRKAIQPQRHIAIRDERDQGLLPLATCKSQIGCLRRLWITCNNLRAKIGRGHRSKDMVRQGQC
jgi:ankyrin repeat protein